MERGRRAAGFPANRCGFPGPTAESYGGSGVSDNGVGWSRFGESPIVELSGIFGVLVMREREVPEPLVVEPWWRRFGSTALTLLRQIARQPLDPLPRLILADFLEENGAPARAEFIRLQVAEMDRRWGWEDKKYWPERERALWQRHRDEWLEGLPKWSWCLWGGLVEGVAVRTPKLWRAARQQIDVRRVSCDFRDFDTLLKNLELLAGVVYLAVTGSQLGVARLRALVQSPSIQHVAVLNLLSQRIGMEGILVLALSPYLQNLTELILGWNGLGDAGVEVLAHFPSLEHLTTLNLWWNGVGDAGAEALAQSSRFPRLSRLWLGFNRIGTAGAEALAESPHLQNLTLLDLGINRIGAAGAEALARSPHFQKLTYLSLNGNQIGDAGAMALAQSPHFPALARLFLGGNEIGDVGAKALAQSPYLQNLTELELEGNPIGAAGREALQQSPYLRQCRVRL
jgi:uncharacterized protein (TIGR02996 family)